LGKRRGVESAKETLPLNAARNNKNTRKKKEGGEGALSLLHLLGGKGAAAGRLRRSPWATNVKTEGRGGGR